MNKFQKYMLATYTFDLVLSSNNLHNYEEMLFEMRPGLNNYIGKSLDGIQPLRLNKHNKMLSGSVSISTYQCHAWFFI